MSDVPSVQDRLLSAVDDFLTAYEKGSLRNFMTHWSQLEEDITSNRQSGSHEADNLVIGVVSCIEELCDAFMTLTHIDDNAKQRISGAIPTSPDDTSTPSPQPPLVNHPLYVKPASEWLMDNLHNPFPTTELREQLSATHSSPRKNIDTWFNEARKRIGWNAIRKRHYGSRKEMLDAASSFFLDRVTCGEFDNEFLEMEKRAKDLYGKNLATSELMQTLDRSVKTMSDEVKKQANEEKRERQLEKRRASHYWKGKAAALPGTLVAGKKRRSYDDDNVEQPSSSRKRSRSQDDEDYDTASTSGSFSRRASSLFSEAPTERSPPSPPFSASSKRRASDFSHDRPRKRLRTSSAPPMTLPTYLVDKWFNQAQSQTQFPIDAEISYDISPWLASMDSLSDSDSSGVTTPTDFPSTISLPDINEANVPLELDLPTVSSSLLPTTTDSLFDLCSPLQTNLPDYDYTSPDFLDFTFDSDLLGLETSNSSLGSLDPLFSIGVTA